MSDNLTLLIHDRDTVGDLTVSVNNAAAIIEAALKELNSERDTKIRRVFSELLAEQLRELNRVSERASAVFLDLSDELEERLK